MMQQTKNYFKLDFDNSEAEKIKANKKYPIMSEIQLQNLLESLCKTENIISLDIIFSSLGFHMLTNPQYADVIITFKPLYDKILIVLNEGLPSKMKLALNLISSLMFIKINENQSKKRTLHMYAQNMIRISGCLSALSHLFTSCMMQHETWSALCQSLSEACYESVLNQNYCSHLVPLCIQRCRQSNRGNPEALLVLQSLLVNHEKNLITFYESEGMSIFSRETLLYTTYLQTLNTIIESTKPKLREYIRNNKIIFKYLHRWLLTDETKSPITQWAAIVLYSRRKLLGLNADELSDEESFDKNFVPEHVPVKDATMEFIKDHNSETRDLFQNVIKEVYEWNTRNNSNKIIPNLNNINRPYQNAIKNRINNLFERNVIRKPKLFLNPRKDLYNKREIANLQYTNMSKADSVLSLSFLLNQNNKEVETKKENVSFTFKYSKYLKTDANIQTSIASNNLKDTFGRTTYTLKEYRQDDTATIKFRPLFVSTPKNLNRHYRNLQHTNKYKKIIKRRDFQRQSPPKYDKNRSMVAKFMDIINVSCSTIVRNISKLKNVFIPSPNFKDNTNSISKLTQNDNCSYSFTNYMTKRDALYADPTKKSECSFGSANSLQSSRGVHDRTGKFAGASSLCRTCNDTVLLKHKLLRHPSLKETVKRLKIGINLYGCDFKKISRILWAREPYMTPEVLYRLYRKLIAK